MPYVFNLILCLGAHSHIRGLGLDDALEPRQVALMLQFIDCTVAVKKVKEYNLV